MALVTVAKVSDVAPGTVKYVEANGARLALCNVGGRFYAIDNQCTHDGGPLDQGYLDGTAIECPRHGARFDVTTGRVLALPAVMPLKTYRVEVDGDEVKVEV